MDDSFEATKITDILKANIKDSFIKLPSRTYISKAEKSIPGRKPSKRAVMRKEILNSDISDSLCNKSDSNEGCLVKTISLYMIDQTGKRG